MSTNTGVLANPTPIPTVSPAPPEKETVITAPRYSETQSRGEYFTLTDTHTHLYLDEFEDGGQSAVRRAIYNGVTRLIMPNVNTDTVSPMHALAEKFPDAVYMAMGLHPTDLGDNLGETLDEIISLFDAHPARYVAVGEIGIDLYWDKSHVDAQQQAFEHQIQVARRLNLPIIIHCREALTQTLEVLKPYGDIRGVFHSFGGTPEDVDMIRRDHDMYFGINGIVTFKNSRLRDTLPAIGLDRLLLETDSPYLAPVPMRGRRNESAFLTHVAAHVAQHLDVPLRRLAQVTNTNADTLFGIASRPKHK